MLAIIALASTKVGGTTPIAQTHVHTSSSLCANQSLISNQAAESLSSSGGSEHQNVEPPQNTRFLRRPALKAAQAFPGNHGHMLTWR